MNRRELLTGMLAAASCGVHAGCCSGRRHDGLPCMTFDGGHVFRITGIGLHRSVRLRMVADTHLALKDDGDVLYSDCYRRMAQWPTPTEPFEAMLRDTLRENPDLLILLGDNILGPVGLDDPLDKVGCCLAAQLVDDGSREEIGEVGSLGWLCEREWRVAHLRQLLDQLARCFLHVSCG